MENRDQAGQGEIAPAEAALTIRSATELDRAFVCELTVTAFAAYGDYHAIMKGWLSDPHTRTVIAERAGRAVGFAMWAQPSPHASEIVLVSLALAPEQRGRGLGRRLLEEVHAAIAAQGRGAVRRVLLDVAEDNAAARALFHCAGYREIRGPEDRYPSGQRALRMLLRLSSAAP